MKFLYRYKTEVSDLWQFSMYYAWSSYLAVINIVCTVSAFALIIACWRDAGIAPRIGMVLFASLFTVIQPLAIWFKAKRRLKGGMPEVELLFDRSGLTVTSEGKTVHKSWGQIKGVAVKTTLVVVYVDGGGAYILPNRVLKETRKDFLSFIKENKK
jgi:hypothetical protein